MYEREDGSTGEPDDGAAPSTGTQAARFSVGGDEYAVLSCPLLTNVDRIGELTAAEREVLVLAVEGRSNDEISGRRGTSIHTVANQLQSIFRKLGVSSRGELVARVLRRDKP